MGFELVKQDVIHHKIEYKEDSVVLGEITWKEIDGIMHMNHTYVSPVLRGQGIAKKLLNEAVNYAHQHNLKMNAICSYVVEAFNRSTVYDEIKL